jgi:hypothetical protein
MKTAAIYVGIVVLWIVLNRWILPWFGVRTCMSGACAVDRCPSCVPGPSDQADKDVTELKGNPS